MINRILIRMKVVQMLYSYLLTRSVSIFFPLPNRSRATSGMLIPFIVTYCCSLWICQDSKSVILRVARVSSALRSVRKTTVLA